MASKVKMLQFSAKNLILAIFKPLKTWVRQDATESQILITFSKQIVRAIRFFENYLWQISRGEPLGNLVIDLARAEVVWRKTTFPFFSRAARLRDFGQFILGKDM